MDPIAAGTSTAPMGLPRTRGDGPFVQWILESSDDGSPAPAGMDPT